MNNPSKSVMRTQKKKKLIAVEAFGGKCCICGYNKCSEALEFHHLNKTEKELSPSYIIMRWSFERARPELDKCLLLCANCHREIHAAEKSSMSLELEKYLKPWVDKNCQHCGNVFHTKSEIQIYCSITCNKLDIRRTERPSKEELTELIEKYNNWSHIGRMFKVSDNAVRKWAKNYGLL